MITICFSQVFYKYSNLASRTKRWIECGERILYWWKVLIRAAVLQSTVLNIYGQSIQSTKYWRAPVAIGHAGKSVTKYYLCAIFCLAGAIFFLGLIWTYQYFTPCAHAHPSWPFSGLIRTLMQNTSQQILSRLKVYKTSTFSAEHGSKSRSGRSAR